MKIAICLSGAPRFASGGIFQQMEKIKGYDEAHFFIRLWESDEYGKTADEIENYLRNNGLPDNCHFKVTQILPDIPENNPPYIELNYQPETQSNILKMFWGIQECYKLLKEYQKKTNEHYDFIFRTRADVLFINGELRLNDYLEIAEKSLIVFPYKEEHHQEATKMNNVYNYFQCCNKDFSIIKETLDENEFSMNDQIWFGTEEIFEKSTRYFDFISFFKEKNIFMHPETTIALIIKKQNIPIYYVPIDNAHLWIKRIHNGNAIIVNLTN
jgi:hypothetical protein